PSCRPPLASSLPGLTWGGRPPARALPCAPRRRLPGPRAPCYRGRGRSPFVGTRMPQFANPGLLWLALLVPPLLSRAPPPPRPRRPRPPLSLPAADALAALPAGGARAARRGGAALRGAALLALAVALAGPRWPDLRTRIETEGIALVMLVDVSGSMAERDFDW